jgi:hypothetical protein
MNRLYKSSFSILALILLNCCATDSANSVNNRSDSIDTKTPKYQHEAHEIDNNENANFKGISSMNDKQCHGIKNFSIKDLNGFWAEYPNENADFEIDEGFIYFFHNDIHKFPIILSNDSLSFITEENYSYFGKICVFNDSLIVSKLDSKTTYYKFTD